MSIERLNQLQNALSAEGWMIANPAQLHSIEDECIIWHLISPDRSSITLQFYVTGEFGDVSTSLNDICFCQSKAIRSKLYFDKINSATWKQGLASFVAALSARCDNSAHSPWGE